MAERQYQIAPGTYINETDTLEYQAAPGMYINETVADTGTTFVATVIAISSSIPGSPPIKNQTLELTL